MVSLDVSKTKEKVQFFYSRLECFPFTKQIAEGY